MKRWLWLGLAVAAFLVGRNGGTDIGRLQPVQVLMVSKAQEGVLLQTDTGDTGKGRNFELALQNMKDTAPLEIFLDTADYLLLKDGGEDLLPELKGYLRPSCTLCQVKGEPDLTQVGEYLRSHPPKLTLNRWLAGEWGFSVLISREGRMELVP